MHFNSWGWWCSMFWQASCVSIHNQLNASPIMHIAYYLSYFFLSLSPVVTSTSLPKTQQKSVGRYISSAEEFVLGRWNALIFYLEKNNKKRKHERTIILRLSWRRKKLVRCYENDKNNDDGDDAMTIIKYVEEGRPFFLFIFNMELHHSNRHNIKIYKRLEIIVVFKNIFYLLTSVVTM